MNARRCSCNPFKSHCLQSFASFLDVELPAPLYDDYNESSETEPSHNCHITFRVLSQSISIASTLLTTFTSMSPTPSADIHWHDQPPSDKNNQDPSREDQPEELPSVILSQVAERLARRHRFKYGNIPASHQNLPKQAPSAGYIGDPAPEDQSHQSSQSSPTGNTEAMSRHSDWETFEGVVGRLERKLILKDVGPAASQRQTTHEASTAQKSSNNPDRDSKSINPSNDTVSGKDN
jgi:hypothetical protein